MSHTKPVTPTSTYWVRAKVSGPAGTSTHKVKFGEGSLPAVALVPEETPGWNFSSREHAEELAEYAAWRAQSDALQGCTVVTEVIEEN